MDAFNNVENIDENKIDEFIKEYGIEVLENEPDHYVDLMMDNHKCVQWKEKQYYLSDNLDLTNEEQEVFDVLVYVYHV